MQVQPFKSINIVPGYTAEGRLINWTIDPVFNDPLPYNFILEGSEDPSFKSIVISKSVGDTYFAVDDSKILQSFPAIFLYRVKLVTPKGEYISEPISYNGGKELQHAYLNAGFIIQRERKRMAIGGDKNQGWFIKRKIYGNTPASKLDPITGEPLTDNTEDFGSRLKSGFYDPIPVLMSIEQRNDALFLDPNGIGTSQIKTRVIRFSGFPIATTRDIIVLKNGERYIVNKYSIKNYPATEIMLVQNMECSIVPNTDPIYSIAVK